MGWVLLRSLKTRVILCFASKVLLNAVILLNMATFTAKSNNLCV